MQAEIARITYRYLRWLMVLLPAVLFVVTVAYAAIQQDLQTSISAYYGTPVRDVFVGVMIATAVCMVAYQGSSLVEDYTLNGAGFYAVFVAFIPTNLDEIVRSLGENPAPGGATVSDYITAMRIAILVVVVLCVGLVVVEFKESARLAQLWRRGTQSQGFIVLTGGVLFLFLTFAAWQLYLPEPGKVTMDGFTLGPLNVRIHDLAAILLIAALAVAVWSHAWPTVVARLEAAGPVPETDLAASRHYRLIFAAMMLGPALFVLYRLWDPDHWIILLEWWEIALFGWFWVRENIRTKALAAAATTAADAAAG
ncbi:MAG: hypothetical protein ACOYBY_14550 [Dermatophilaceae bacterium]